MGMAKPPDEDAEKEQLEKERKLVAKCWKEFEDARKFDDEFLRQVAVDRRYAAGTADMTWAVSTNLIGAFIDILVALLYARNPDVSVRKSPQVDDSNTQQQDQFARTLEIVISHLWRKGNLKKSARKSVRSILSTGEGWIKAMMVSEKTPKPLIEKQLNDAQATLADLQANQKLLDDPNLTDTDERAAKVAEQQALVETLQAQVEQAVTKMFVIDFIPVERIQVSTDVSSIEDYLDADWIANELYVTKEGALASCPSLEAKDLEKAKLFYQGAPKATVAAGADSATGLAPQGQITAESAQSFTTSSNSSEQTPFYHIVEVWDRRDKHIRTMVEGVERWGVQPYNPPYPTSRFYSFFFFSFYQVDGVRHPQSLSWRMQKLQDEYSRARSNFRLTRERSIPGIIFNSTALDAIEAEKLTSSKHQELTGIKPTDPAKPLTDIFAPKPVANVDMRVFDPTYILNDMERISGVQEALSSAINGPGNPKTATEASIQQSGTNARTTSDRDNLEEMLNDLAQYTAEQSLQCLQTRDVQRMAGVQAFWPEGMDIEDLFTLVEVQIEAGTTGKPKQQTDQQAWATILPLIQQMMGQIEQALAMGNKPMADCLTALIRETMVRLGDESDIDRFIPKTPPPGSPGAGAPPPPVKPTVSVSLKGELSPEAAALLVTPAIAQDQAAMPPPAQPEPPPGAATAGPGQPPPPVSGPSMEGAPGGGLPP